MIPVDGDNSAATQCNSGSSRRASAASRRSTSSTPLARAAAAILSSAGKLRLVGGDDDLAEPRVRDAVVAAIGVEPPAALDAGRRLQTVLRIIDAAVDDLAVARRGLEPDRPGAVEDEHLAAGERQSPRRGKPDHPGADHDAFDFVHAALHRLDAATFGSLSALVLVRRQKASVKTPDLRAHVTRHPGWAARAGWTAFAKSSTLHFA